MATYTQELSNEYSFPHILLYAKLKDGVQYAWQLYPENGYVMYDTTDETTELQEDPETGEMIEVPVTYYYTDVSLPLRYDFNNFPWVAVLRSSVDENYIFGLPNDNHETV